MSDGFYLPRHDQYKLIELLDQIPFLVEQLARARVGSRKLHLTC